MQVTLNQTLGVCLDSSTWLQAPRSNEEAIDYLAIPGISVIISLSSSTISLEMNTLLLATTNAGKIKELKELLKPLHCLSQLDVNIPAVEETGLSFIENAILKARHAAALAKMPALADDSGLVVPALAGKPGIYSARFAGAKANDQDNIQHLLAQLKTVATTDRQAYFYCAIAVVKHAEDPTPLIATGRLDGYISLNPQGEGGFGYDPVFYIEEQKATLAQLPAEYKYTVSHRARALAQLKKQWSEVDG